MGEKTRLKHRVEYWLIRIIGGFLNVLPYRCALAVAWVLGRLIYMFAGSRKHEAFRRVRLVFGDSLSDREVKRICWISFRNTFFNAVEMMRIRKLRAEQLLSMVSNADAVIDLIKKTMAEAEGRGIVVALPHMGNWDLAGSVCIASGIPVFSVAAKQRNKRVNELMNYWRSGHGMDVIERGGGTLRQILTRLRDGQVFAILPDTRSFNPDLLIPFLGGEANLARGMASFAYTAKVPVLPIVVRRTSWTGFSVEMHDPVWPDSSIEKSEKDEELRRITEIVIKFIDRAIHETPEQWFWYNKRWVLDPVESAIARSKKKQ
jgi:lauroyl/myristoyl acyltransferase